MDVCIRLATYTIAVYLTTSCDMMSQGLCIRLTCSYICINHSQFVVSVAPYVSLFEARRLNETHFNISISLLYTGGGDTTTFSVYFREQDSIEWSSDPIMVLILDSLQALEYHGVISGEEKLRGKGPLEFELRVKNGRGFMNRTGSGPEKSGRSSRYDL